MSYLPMNLVEPSNSSLHPLGMYAMDLQRRLDLLITGHFSQNQRKLSGARDGRSWAWMAGSGVDLGMLSPKTAAARLSRGMGHLGHSCSRSRFKRCVLSCRVQTSTRPHLSKFTPLYFCTPPPECLETGSMPSASSSSLASCMVSRDSQCPAETATTAREGIRDLRSLPGGRNSGLLIPAE